MTPQQINIAIAEACGWIKVRQHWERNGEMRWNNDALHYLQLPDYCHDLDAMHEAWCQISPPKHYEFRKHLQQIVLRDGHTHGPCRSCCNATAPQRAEAFLRTIGKWEEKALDQCQPKA